MSSYKVIQDIEAEDKILGPLTLRQFIYAGISALFLYLTYFVMSKGATFMIGAFLPVALVAAFFAVPWGRDQPTEIWALAKIRFMLKPRRRIWDQSAIKELVTITAPKKDGPRYTIKNLSQTEVKSRLLALADTLDSRGWAVKNASINMGQAMSSDDAASDRLIGASSFQQQSMQVLDIRAADDILDEQNNPIAQQMNNMIEASARAHREKIINNLSQTQVGAPVQQPASNYWFMNQPTQAASIPDDMVTFNTQVVTPGMQEQDLAPGAGAPAQPTVDEENLVRQLDAQRRNPAVTSYGHMHSLQPIARSAPPAQQPASALATPPIDSLQPEHPPGYSFSMNATPIQTAPPPVPRSPAPQVTPQQQAAILQLANNDDLSLATIAREAERSGPQNDGEVVINLH